MTNKQKISKTNIPRPLFSVIIATFNAEKYLEQTLESIQNQNFRNFELIIIDGGSKDNTLNIIQKYSSYTSYFVSEPDNGIYDAWNKAVLKAKGEWMCFLGSDDIMLPNALETYSNFLKTNKFIDLEYISSKILFVTSNLQPIGYYGRKWEWRSHRFEMRVAHVGSLHHRSLFKKYGLFDTTYKIAGDYELLLRPKHLLKSYFIDTVTIKMRRDGASNTNLLVFKEAMKAKVITAGRNRYLCKIEHAYSIAKFYLLKVIRA